MSSSMQSASIYLRRGFYYVHPLAGSGGGDPALLMEPVMKLEEGVDASVLGEAVTEALRLSHHHAPWPTDWKHVTDPLFAAAGGKSLSTFVNGARNVRVDLTAKPVSVLPTSSTEQRNAFSPLTALTVRLPLNDSAELGLAVRKALAASE